MKRSINMITALVLTLCMMLGCLSAAAAADDTGKTVINYGDWVLESVNSDTGWEISSYIGSNTDIVIPDSVEGLPIVSLGDHCFANNTDITSVTLSNGIEKIGEYVFAGCTALEKVDMNSSLGEIGEGAFSGTSALKSADMTKTAVSSVPAYAFTDSGVENVSLPLGCAELGEYAFGGCAKLKGIIIPYTVTVIADDAFEGCEGFVLYSEDGSPAIEYAKANGIEYVVDGAVAKYTFLIGDTDGDGKVTILDATMIQRLLADLTVDSDGLMAIRAASGEKLNIMHATGIQRYLAGFPVEGNIGEESFYMQYID